MLSPAMRVHSFASSVAILRRKRSYRRCCPLGLAIASAVATPGSGAAHPPPPVRLASRMHRLPLSVCLSPPLPLLLWQTVLVNALAHALNLAAVFAILLAPALTASVAVSRPAGLQAFRWATRLLSYGIALPENGGGGRARLLAKLVHAARHVQNSCGGAAARIPPGLSA